MVLTDLKQKLKRFYCDDKMTKEHVSGEWKKTEDYGWYSIYVKKCKLCNKVLGDKVIK